MSFVEIQNEFMDYIKNPANPLPEGIEQRRMSVYRELFFNNVKGFVSNAFPVLETLYSEKQWEALVQEFFITHDCQTPIFVEIAQEFLIFLQSEYELKEHDPVFMLELAHYEWLELVVSVAQESKELKSLDVESIESANLCLSESAKVAQYSFDVQHISADYQPIESLESPRFYCVYRDADEEVSFLQLTPLSAQVLSFIEHEVQTSFEAITSWLHQMYPQMELVDIEQGCLQLLQQMAEKKIVLSI
ncbi:putative DNA-binding domain-containing protein [Shewanella sp. 202IG2-18]|uniref:HvfC family RiPP maturation protein n=1 Tax=Parashewanella hymeniacidonis TaxID=2807618 RepID=UPI001961E9AA|nr:putative DNA-binding domain-containing protein [Parashewanella hymeniacidonis]MBM7073973.1 putative DNA-binding domain-containing protein [Parashewanella hymeniacidonis]